MILYINACVRENSRTKQLADFLISHLEGEVYELKLAEISFPTTDEMFLRKRDELIANKQFWNPMFSLANQFADAEKIVIACPYWDLSFPASLKQYFEYINVLGITFEYTEEGYPKGLCSAEKLYYVTTAGGSFVPYDFGFGYVKVMAENFYGIHDIKLYKAEGLDIYGADTQKIMNKAFAEIERDFV